MKNYRDSDYAVNKYASGIVYRFADYTVEVTLEDYLRENSSKTEADFAELKALSDEVYLEQDRANYRQTYKDILLHSLDENEACAVSSAEELLIDQLEKEKEQQQRRQLAYEAFSKLTEVQKRRYLLYTVNGLTIREIAKIEGVVHSKIQKSLSAAEKKIKKFLSKA